MTTHGQIADDLRRRVRAGELAPGTKVPSTRALARRWKVAPATAAHALRVLVGEGVLRSVPRSGTLVAPPPGGMAGEPPLSRVRLLDAALAIADAEGLGALSIRSLAARLGAAPMALYRHVRDKDELLQLLADAGLAEVCEQLTEPPPPGWRAQLAVAARSEWRVVRRRPWLGRLLHMHRPAPMPNALRLAEYVLRALDRSPLSAPDKLHVHLLLHGLVQGLAVNLEAEAQARGETGIDDDGHMRLNEHRFAEIASSGRLPSFARLLREMPERFDLDFDALFELGLVALLDGLAPWVEGRRRLSGSPSRPPVSRAR